MMRSRIATAAITASLVAGLAACSTTSKAPAGGASTAPSASPSTAAAAGAATSAAPTAPATASSSAAPDTPASFATDQLERMRAKVAAVYGQAFTPGSAHLLPPTVNQQELAADFDSKATRDAVWGTGAASADRPMDCGMAKYNGIALGMVRSSGDAATIPVALYNAEKAGSAVAIVSVDPATGVIKGVTCGGAPAATDFPGIAPIGTYYGATASLDTVTLDDKSQSSFTPAFTAWEPADSNYNKYTCTQDVPELWTVALTGTSASASMWDYQPGPVRSIPDPQVPSATGFMETLGVDLGSEKISRVTCRAFPPALDKTNPASYVSSLINYYRLAQDQKSLGVDPAAAIRSFFVSDAAFTTAWNNTGTVPLLCSPTVPGVAATADNSTGTTSGSQITFKMVTWKQWHPDNPGQELSKFTLVMDANTMKIASITCTK